MKECALLSALTYYVTVSTYYFCAPLLAAALSRLFGTHLPVRTLKCTDSDEKYTGCAGVKDNHEI